MTALRTTLFAPGETIATPRLVLSAATAPDARRMEWLGAALAPEWSADDLLPHVEAGQAIAFSKLSGDAIGIAVAVADAPEDRGACLCFIAVEPAERFRGLGGEAAFALERRIRSKWGSKRLLALVPENRGLAVYFWLRLGYRPLTVAEAPWPALGLNGKPAPGIWMARDLEREAP